MKIQGPNVFFSKKIKNKKKIERISWYVLLARIINLKYINKIDINTMVPPHYL